jgi:hypothetical protein
MLTSTGPMESAKSKVQASPLLYRYWPVLVLQGWPVIIHGHVPPDIETGQCWSYRASRSHSVGVSPYFLHAGQYWSYEVGQSEGMGLSLIVYLLASTCSTEPAGYILWLSRFTYMLASTEPTMLASYHLRTCLLLL